MKNGFLAALVLALGVASGGFFKKVRVVTAVQYFLEA
jgi:hypothetical protein